MLVHLDLHPGNALRAGGEWKAIDPRGARADRHAEIWALICPEAPVLPDDPAAARRVARHRLKAVRGRRGLDSDRAAAWTRVRASAEASSPDVGHDPGWADRLRRTETALSYG